MEILDLLKTGKQKYFDLTRVGPTAVHNASDRFFAYKRFVLVVESKLFTCNISSVKFLNP